ncbi:MAG: sigma-70 family RNA polymerase sigma factor [Leptolyngbya sp. PLA1]|nr:sigma-70 family RNA polymerase sigma factor [Leptolyngbya sp. PLA1]
MSSVPLANLPADLAVTTATPSPWSDASDEAVAVLTRAIRAGDAGAFEALYRGWYARVVGLAIAASGRDESFALDVAQDTMLRVAAGLPVLSSRAALGAWMHRTTLRVVIDRLRAARRREARERAASRPEAARDQPGTERTARGLERLLGELRLSDYEALRARVVEERTLDETGLAAGVSGDAAHGRVRRAMEGLRTALSGMLP